MLERMNTSFDVVSQFLDSVEVNGEGIEKIEQVGQTMAKIGPALTQMRDTMFEESADEEEWSVYSSTLEKFDSVMGTLKVKVEESAAFLDLEDESVDEEVDGEKLIEALKYAESEVDHAKNEDDLRYAKEALDYVSGNLNGFEGEVKSKFEEATELVVKNLKEKKTRFEERERLNVLERMNTSFDVVSQFLDSVEVNGEGIEKIEQVGQTMAKIGPALTQMRDTMFEESADEEEWSVYSSTLEKFDSVMGTLKVKVEESAAFLDLEDESVDEEVDGEKLIEALKYAESEVDHAKNEDDLRYAKEALDYVSGNLNGFEGEVKSKFEEATELLFEELDERRTGFEDAFGSRHEDSVKEAVGEMFVDALEYVNSVVEDKENVEELLKAEEILDVVRDKLIEFEGEVRSKFESATELLTEKLEERKSFEKDERAD